MGESLWADLDAFQVDYLFTRLGTSAQYATLLARLVVAAIVRDYHEWDNSDVWEFPAIIVSSSRVLRPPEGAQSGEGIAHYRKTYPYSWLAVVEGDSFSSENDAKILEKRLETAARELVANGWSIGPDGSGERLIDVYIGNSNFARFSRASLGDSDAWYGVVSLDLDFITTV
jgi:hypothetical protein